MKIPENVKTEYDKWNDFLQNKVEFWLKDSEKHTKEHCSRVLLYSLLIGEAERKILLYQIFKDADALDRFRLGPDGLDVRYLRTDAAKELYEYAKMVWYQYFAKEEGGITNAS